MRENTSVVSIVETQNLASPNMSRRLWIVFANETQDFASLQWNNQHNEKVEVRFVKFYNRLFFFYG